MERVLNLFVPGGAVARPPRRRPRFLVASQAVAEVVATRLLREYPRSAPTTLEAIHLVAGTWFNLPLLHGVEGSDASPPADGTGLFLAARASGSLSDVVLEGFRLSGDRLSRALAGDAIESNAPPPAAAPLRSLSLFECAFLDPVPGAGAFLTSLIRSRDLEHLDLRGTPLPLGAVDALCRALAASEGDLWYLQLGRGRHYGTDPCIGDDSVAHFFEALPTLKKLRIVVLNRQVPEHLYRTVMDGVKNNYWLLSLGGQCFGDDDDDNDEERRAASARFRDEMWSYLHANAGGRRAAVYDAVVAMQDVMRAGAHPDDRPPIEEAKVRSALGVLEQLAGSDDMTDVTSRYLCVRLFLPAALGGGGGGTRRDDPSCLARDRR